MYQPICYSIFWIILASEIESIYTNTQYRFRNFILLWVVFMLLQLIKTENQTAAAKSLQLCLTLYDPIDPSPWDSPGKNTGVGCHFLLQCIKVKSESEVAQSCPTLSDPMDCSLPGSSVHGIFQAGVLECGAIAFSENQISLEHNLIN